ncbi:hypothetical protein L596_018948 [Steinernema carpocapsae]|uniref:Large ribosomal subunit protein eL33 n=1 Tax=Steinernema carpocapsae TaxID=34508 RepID=A0A4U5N6M8_STECR|nr:hypothetical protein L596_018948 [Steinernema carpocapsae]
MPMLTSKSAGKLHVKGVFTGFKRGLRKQSENTSLIKLDGVFNKEDAQYYVGKRAVYIYKAKKTTATPGKTPSRVRAIWGKVTRVHGNSGVVRAKFAHNLPPKAMGHRIRVVSYFPFSDYCINSFFRCSYCYTIC